MYILSHDSRSVEQNVYHEYGEVGLTLQTSKSLDFLYIFNGKEPCFKTQVSEPGTSAR